MENEARSLTLEPGAWSAEADRLIGQAVTHAPVEAIRHQVEACGASLFYVKDGGAIVGAVVLRVDHLMTGPEGVVVAAAGQAPGVDMTLTVMPGIERLLSKCRTVRYHTAHPALARKLARLGYVAREIVCFKSLQHDPIET